MPRRRYPSDESRLKQRPHAKVHLSARSHPRYGQVFEDPEARGIIWGLWLLAVQYHAAQTGDEVTLGLGDLVWLTGRAQRAPALNALRTVCERMEYPVREVGRSVVVQVRNLKRKQGFGSADCGETPRTPPPSEEQKNQGTKEQSSAPRTPRSQAASPPPSLLEAAASAFALHGKRIQSWSAARRKVLAARLREHTEAEVVSAVHGYQYLHRSGNRNGFDPAAYFTPETIFAAGKFEKYLDAAREAEARGLSPPFEPDAPANGGGKSMEVLRTAIRNAQAGGDPWKT